MNRHQKKIRDLRQMLKKIYWTIYSLRLVNPPLRTNFRSILFVCKGNICRSPFAHYYAQNKHNGRNNFSIGSAGLCAQEGNTSPPKAIEAANSLGVCMATHRPMPITRDDMEKTDMIVVMEPWQRRQLIRQSPKNKSKIYLMPLFLKDTKFYGKDFDRCNIRDPYGKELPAFIDSFQRIQAAVDIIFNEADSQANGISSIKPSSF